MHYVRLDQRGARRSDVIHSIEELGDERRVTGDPRCRVAGSRGPGIDRTGREERVVARRRKIVTGRTTHTRTVEVGLRRVALDESPRRDDLRFDATIVARTAAREARHVPRIVAVTRVLAAPVSVGRIGVRGLARPDREDILRRCGRAYGTQTRTGISVGEDEEKLLIAGNRATSVARHRVVELGVGIVATRHIGSPGVRADAGATLVVVVDHGRVAGADIEPRSKDPHVRHASVGGDPEAVVESAGVLEGGAGRGVVAADDRCVDVSVPVGTLRAGGARARWHHGEEDAAGERIVAGHVELVRLGRSRAVVDTIVDHDDDRVVRGLRREVIAGQPAEIAGTRGVLPRDIEVASHDLVLTLAKEPGPDVGLDPDDGCELRDLFESCARDRYAHVHVASSDRFLGSGQQRIRQREDGVDVLLDVLVVEELYGHLDRRRHGFANVERPGERVIRQVIGVVLDLGRLRGARAQRAGGLFARSPDQVRVLGNVLHDPGTGCGERLEIRVHRRSGELDQLQATRIGFGQAGRSGRGERLAREADLVEIVAHDNSRRRQHGRGGSARNGHHDIRAATCDYGRAGLLEFRHHLFVPGIDHDLGRQSLRDCRTR